MNLRDEITGIGLVTNVLVVGSVVLLLGAVRTWGLESLGGGLAVVFALVCAHYDGVRTEHQRRISKKMSALFPTDKD